MYSAVISEDIQYGSLPYRAAALPSFGDKVRRT